MQNLNIINKNLEEIKKTGLFLVKDYVCDVCGDYVSHITSIKFLGGNFRLCKVCHADHILAQKAESPLNIKVLQSPS